MSKNINKTLYIYNRQSTSSFKNVNKTVVSEEGGIIGPTVSAAKAMVANTYEQRSLMRTILGLDPTSPSSNWDKEVQKYWNSIFVEIPAGGKKLEIGFEYDFKSPDKDILNNVQQLIKSNKDITNSDKLAQYVEDKVDEEDKYKYATPINIEDYILYRYCLEYSHVANSIEEVNNSPRIRFYLYSDQERTNLIKKQHSVNKKAITYYLEIIEDKDKVENMIYALNKAHLLLDAKTKEDKEIIIEDAYKQAPIKFIEAYENKSLQTIAMIEKLIASGILRRLPNTGAIVNSMDATDIIGNTIADAVSYMTNDSNKAKVSELIGMYKTLPQKQ